MIWQYDQSGLKDRFIVAAIVLFFTIGLLDVFLPNADVILITRILQASGAATVVVVYWPDFIEAYRSEEPEQGDFLIFGITIGWIATLCQALFVIVFRLAGNPWWFANSDLNLLWITMSVLSAIMHVLAPGAIRGKVPQRNRVGLGIGVFVGVSLVCGAMVVRPDISGTLELLRPYIADVFKSGDSTFQPPEVDVR